VARKLPLSQSDLYRFHVENLRSIERALREIEFLCKEAIRRSRQTVVDSLLRTHLLLVGTWVECRLRKLLYEQNGFTDKERQIVLSEDTQEKRWISVIETGFQRRYGVKTLSKASLKHTAFARYHELISVVENDVGPIIELRNKLAHGHWEYLLTTDGIDISQDMMKRIHKENLLSSKIRLQMVNSIANIVHDLVLSKSFERDFDVHFDRFEASHRSLLGRDYESYVRELQARHAKGVAKRGAHPRKKP